MSHRNPRSGRAGEEEGEQIDRLGALPDHILHHILSFLPTKDSVQTTLLSTRWRSLWKHVPHLNLDGDSFPSFERFRGFLHRVLSALSDDSVTRYRDLDRVMEYAHESHRAAAATRYVSIHSGKKFFSFLDLDRSFWDCDVGSLELRRVSFHGGEDWVGFRMVRSLKLGECELYSLGNGGFDFFAQFSCMERLVVSGCGFFHAMKCFKISGGPKLVSLEIHGMNLRKAPVCIVAPELKLLSIVFDSGVAEFSQLSLPVLDHAEIGFVSAPKFVERKKGRVTAKFLSLFQGLQNATSLRLDCHAIKAMSEVCDRWEHQPCPFTRLKCLKVPRSDEPYTIPDQVISYFLKGSSGPSQGFLEFV